MKFASSLEQILYQRKIELTSLEDNLNEIGAPLYLDFTDVRDYIFIKEDRLRNTDKERSYLKLFRNLILGSFDNKCAVCKEQSNGMEFDHFYIPKTQYGCFYLTHRLGYKINNTVPLCITCNRAKGARPYSMLCDEKTLLYIKMINRMINKKINKNELSFTKELK